MRLKIDLHVHTNHSYDGLTSLEAAIKAAKQRGLNGIAITDHDAIERIRNISKTNIILIPGIEISTKAGHLIALGIKSPIPPNLTALETAKRIRRQGGLVVVPHPYDRLSHGMGREDVKSIKPDAIEVINSSSLTFSRAKNRNQKLAEELHVAEVAGSDSHIPETIGDAYTIIETNSTKLNEILRAIKNGKTVPEGTKTTLKNRLREIWLKTKIKIGI